MKSTHLAFCFVLLASFLPAGSGAAAQAPQNSYGVAGMENLSGPPALQRPLQVVPAGCPISLRAQHGASASLQQAGQNRPKGLAQLLHLTLAYRDSRPIIAARVRVHGLSGKPRATETLASSTESDAVRNVEVHFSSAGNKTATADLWVPAMTAVFKIDLISVTYADGATRSFSVDENCRVAPDPLMLVASH